MGLSDEITSSFDYALSILPESDLPGFAMILVDQEVWDNETSLAFLRSLKSSTKVFPLANSVSSTNEINLANLVATVVTKPLRLSVLISCFQETHTVGNKTAVVRRPPSTHGTLLREKRILVVDDNIVDTSGRRCTKEIWSYYYLCRRWKGCFREA